MMRIGIFQHQSKFSLNDIEGTLFKKNSFHKTLLSSRRADRSRRIGEDFVFIPMLDTLPMCNIVTDSFTIQWTDN